MESVKKANRLQDRNKNNKLAKLVYDEENRKYFESIQSAPQLSLDVQELPKDQYIYVSSKSAVVLWIVESLEIDEWVDLYLVPSVSEFPKFNGCTGISIVDTEALKSLSINDTLRNIEFDSKSDYKASDYIRYCSYKILERAEKSPCGQYMRCNSEMSIDNNGEIKRNWQNMDTESCKRPSIYIQEKRLIICGLSSVLRFLLKFTSMKMEISLRTQDNPVTKRKYERLQVLLGFRGGCLQACAEVSIWTRFCEFDMTETLIQAIQKLVNTNDNDTLNPNKNTCETKSEIRAEEIPKDLLRFEHHLRKPVRVHNIRKEFQSKQKKIESEEKSQESNKKSTEDCSELEHEYAEGPHMLLSDLILFPCIYLLLRIHGEKLFEKHLTKTLIWFRKMNTVFNLTESGTLGLNFGVLSYTPEKVCDIEASKCNFKNTTTWRVPEVPEESLYKSDPARDKDDPSSKLFTKQNAVEEALNSVSSSGIEPFEVKQVTSKVNWDEIPVLAHPEGGRLPKKRRERKCQQLSCMTAEVMKVVEEKSKHTNNRSSFPLRIVDFCSGGGHLGILLAWLLPKCQIILVENKEESLRRGRERVEQLGLPNVSMYQCNLDYFDGHFEIGVALHACGTATDLVLSKCIAANASFVCCPCCYGAIQSNHMLHYPRSSTFSKSSVSSSHYFTLAHASDQTHDEENEKTPQGKRCMQLIDTDRCLNAQENGYKVYLTKIFPDTASPKNHILVGIST